MAHLSGDFGGKPSSDPQNLPTEFPGRGVLARATWLLELGLPGNAYRISCLSCADLDEQSRASKGSQQGEGDSHQPVVKVRIEWRLLQPVGVLSFA